MGFNSGFKGLNQCREEHVWLSGLFVGLALWNIQNRKSYLPLVKFLCITDKYTIICDII